MVLLSGLHNYFIDKAHDKALRPRAQGRVAYDKVRTPFMHAPFKIFLLATLIYTIFTYGGVRSPDSEVTFRTAEALAFQGTPGVNQPLQLWPEFNGFQKGRDGHYYSLFGPGEAYALSLFLPLADQINRTGWYRAIPTRIPVSHYTGEGINAVVLGRVPADVRPHALRLLMSLFPVVVSALSAMIFFLLARVLTGRETGAWYATIAFAFASLAFPYSGTFCNEPLATLFMLLSLLLMTRHERGLEAAGRQQYVGLFGAGLLLGLAVSTHVTAVLFVPFFFIYALAPAWQTRRAWSSALTRQATSFAAGLGVIALLLAEYNYMRFGHILETGRTLSNDYNACYWPWHGLNYLLISSGKGLLWYCPVVLLGLLVWRSFYQRYKFLSVMLAAVIVFRLFFLACIFWRCGFCLGPRYLVPIIPLLLLPIATWVEQQVETRQFSRLTPLLLALCVCTAQQLFFALGEPFAFLHVIRDTCVSRDDMSAFNNDGLYMNWDFSPALYLLEGVRGPFLLGFVPLGNYALWGLCSVLATLALCLWHARNLKAWKDHGRFPLKPAGQRV